MTASYPQVVIAQRNYFRAQVDYIDALVRYWEDRAKIEGFLLTGGLERQPAAPDEF
jgi:outer membrane protein TolC